MIKFWLGLLAFGVLLMMLGMFWLPLAAIVPSSLGLGYEVGQRTKPRSLER